MIKSLFTALLSGLSLIAFMAEANTQGRVSLSQESFVSPDYKATQKKDFQFIGVGVDTLSKAKKESEIENGLQAQIDANLAPGNSVMNYLNISQLYWRQGDLAFGRKKLIWSELDESYQLGLFQPNFSWNILQPESQGLTGLFLNVAPEGTSVPVGIQLFASNIFIPDQGAGYEIKDGQFQNSNPYFQAPPTQAVVNGQTDAIVYDVQKPRTEDIVFRSSYAGKAYMGDDSSGFYAQMAYANKPSNQLTLGFKGVLTPNNAIAVDILPAAYNHRLFSGDLQYSFASTLTLGVSALNEFIENPTFVSDWTYAQYSNSQMVSPFIKSQIGPFKVKLSYLTLTGADRTAVGPRADLASSILPYRYPFSSAYLAELGFRYRLRRYQGIILSTRYLSGSKSEFALWTSRGAYQWEERWSAYFETQLAAVDKGQAGEKIAYQDYMNNDTAVVGVQHVF